MWGEQSNPKPVVDTLVLKAVFRGAAKVMLVAGLCTAAQAQITLTFDDKVTPKVTPSVESVPGKIVLYSTTVGSSTQYPNSLLTVDPASGAQQLVGQPGQAAGLEWLTANPVNNMLYGTGLLTISGLVDESTLYIINPNSGAISGKVTLSQNVSAVAASPQGTLYGLSGNTLGTINTATGAFSFVGTLSLSPGYFLESMAFSPDGTLYGVTVTNVGALDQQLITLNPATGATASVLGSLQSQLNVGDITYAADGNIYATNFSYFLLKIDPQTLSNTAIGNGNIGDLGGIAASVSINAIPIPVTVTTVPPGLQVFVDGATYPAPYTVSWAPGSIHTVGVNSPQTSGNTQAVFLNWADNASQIHSVYAPSSPTTYTATFKTQYLLTTTVSPSGGGTITASPPSPAGDGFYDAGTVVQLTETPASGFAFEYWTNDLSGVTNPQGHHNERAAHRRRSVLLEPLRLRSHPG